ncbi:MAG: hypothetical protein O2930_00110 [Acidobacteria bacterium]|nr:hypothetical protein [Acidobacteriota bacterium]
MTRRPAAWIAMASVVLPLVFVGGWISGRLGMGDSPVDPVSLSDLEGRFTERMRNVTLVGTFTVDGREDGAPREDRYRIESVEKVDDDLWRFRAVVGDGGSVIPIVVPLRWIGDTPMLMMTDTSLPGMGTFTVRLFFYRDHYAGTWQHGEVGGLMSGRIEGPAAE